MKRTGVSVPGARSARLIISFTQLPNTQLPNMGDPRVRGEIRRGASFRRLSAGLAIWI